MHLTRQRSILDSTCSSILIVTLNPYIKSALDSSRDKKIHESRADIVQDETGIAVQVQLRIIVFNDPFKTQVRLLSISLNP